MEVCVVKWGNGQGIRIPKGVLRELGISVGEPLVISTDHERIILEKKYRHRSLEERAESFGGELGPYTEYNWGEPAGREIW